MNTNITTYIENFPKEIQEIFIEIYDLINKYTINVEEKLWAKLPSFYIDENFIRLIPFKDHINIEAKAIKNYADMLTDYKLTPKSMLQIYINENIPYAILKKIILDTLYTNTISFGYKEVNQSYYHREGVYIISIKDNKIALVNNNGNFYLPGGGIEINESHKTALSRELLEETGHEILVDKYYLSTEFYGFFNDKYLHSVQYYYEGTFLDKICEPLEQGNLLQWIPLYSLDNILESPMQKFAVNQYLNRHLKQAR